MFICNLFTIFAYYLILQEEYYMSTITINSDIYQKAERYAKLNNINLSHLIEKFLMKLQTPSAKDNAALALPDHLEKLAGCLSDVSDDDDEKLNYLLEKYK